MGPPLVKPLARSCREPAGISTHHSSWQFYMYPRRHPRTCCAKTSASAGYCANMRKKGGGGGRTCAHLRERRPCSQHAESQCQNTPDIKLSSEALVMAQSCQVASIDPVLIGSVDDIGRRLHRRLLQRVAFARIHDPGGNGQQEIYRQKHQFDYNIMSVNTPTNEVVLEMDLRIALTKMRTLEPLAATTNCPSISTNVTKLPHSEGFDNGYGKSGTYLLALPGSTVVSHPDPVRGRARRPHPCSSSI